MKAAFTQLVIVIPCDMTQKARIYKVKREPSLLRLQRMVGGYIERVPHWYDFDGAPCNVWINEEGKLDELPINVRATLMWYQKLRRRVNDCLVGNVVIVIGFPEEGEYDS